MIRVLLVTFLFFSLNLAALAESFEEIYQKQKNADFEYIFNLDPFQAEDYTKYIVSPYPLLRTSVYFRLKDLLIPPGYYLLTPRERGGENWILFKENGKVKYIVPVYKTGIVDPLFYNKYVPTPKKTNWEKTVEWTHKMVAKMSKKSMRTPIPKSYIDVNEIGGEFWEVVLYYDLKSYHMLFKTENYK